MQSKFLTAFLSLVLAVALLLPAGTASAATDKQYRGVDVSVWQGEIDFEEVKDSGIDAVYIRAGEGTNLIDQYFERNYEGAKEAGLKYGFYHYVTARSEDEAEEQATFFANLIKTKPYDMRAAMDFENLSGLSASEAVSIAEAYLEKLEDLTGHTPVVYSDAYDAESVWKSSLKKYPLWIADYGVKKPYTTGGWSSWDGFQYSDRGSVKGINGHVDLDLFESGILLDDDEKEATRNIRHDYSKANDGCDCETENISCE